MNTNNIFGNWKVTVLAKDVFEVRNGSKSVVLEGDFHQNCHFFRILDIPKEWNDDQDNPTPVTTNDITAIQEAFRKYLRNHPIRWLAREKCQFLAPGQEPPTGLSMGIRFVKWIRGNKLI